MTEDEMVGWHHRLDGHEFEQTLGDNDGPGSLACCSPWGRPNSQDLSCCFGSCHKAAAFLHVRLWFTQATGALGKILFSDCQHTAQRMVSRTEMCLRNKL